MTTYYEQFFFFSPYTSYKFDPYMIYEVSSKHKVGFGAS